MKHSTTSSTPADGDIQIAIHSSFYVEITHPGGTLELEYDDAGDFVDAAHQGQSLDELARCAIAAEGKEWRD